ncbi:MAG TPA: efflux RND transporter permease subunit [Bauldia sp.]
MRRIVDIAVSHARLTIAILVFLLAAGALAYLHIPKESQPDVQIPYIYVQLSDRGISPEDSERLLLRPMETQLKTVTDVKQMRSAAFEGGGYVLMEFNAGFNSDVALQDVRAKVDAAKPFIPTDADEPGVYEVSLSLFPVISVGLTGDISERTLTRIATDLQNSIKQVNGVLSADLQGTRDQAVEIIAEPMLLKSYGVDLTQFGVAAAQNNSLVAAGDLEGKQGSFGVKVPALIETPEDVLNIPVAASKAASVTLGDVATVLPTFKDATSITRVNGKPAVVIDVSKRAGANLIDTVAAVKAVVAEAEKGWPDAVKVQYIGDQSVFIKNMLSDLQNSVTTAILLVVVVILFILGGRASIFIGIALPFAFLTGVLGLNLFGATMNIVVLFSLILAVGMLVDDAIIVSEFAERRMGEGMKPKEAYAFAAARMAGPVTAATLTRIAAFSPLLLWPGIVGQFMKYLPITLIATLSASLVAALVFTPTLGSLIGRAHDKVRETAPRDGIYMKTVRQAIHHPWIVLMIAFGLLIAVPTIYGKVGAGVEFFPNVEPDTGAVLVHARGNLSLAEKDRLVQRVESVVLGENGISTVYARSGNMGQGSQDITEDVIGKIQFEFINWKLRPTANALMQELRDRTADIPGIKVEVTAAQAGPPTGKPIQVQLSSIYPDALEAAAKQVTAELAEHPEIKDLDSGLPMPGIDWALQIDKAEAAKYGIGVGAVGAAVQLVTNGMKITDYRPPDSDKPVDIIVRVPEDRRTLNQLDTLEISTPQGSVPISNFVKRVPQARVGLINRVDGERVVTVTANVAVGAQTAAVQDAVSKQLAAADFKGLVKWKLVGSDEDRAEAQAFLVNAGGAAIFLIFAVLLAQFNKLSSVALVLSAVVLSTIGVFIGLIVTHQAFGVVMTGIGIIALAGIVTNNNIVLIDTYDRLRREGVSVDEAILRTCRERARPVLLTAVTAVLGVLPIAFGLNVDFVHREITFGAPSTQWWIQLSTAIVFGLSFSTALTLVVTPASLSALARGRAFWDRLTHRRGRTVPAAGGGAPAHARAPEDHGQF